MIVENWSNWIVALLTATLGLGSGLLLERLRRGESRRSVTSAAEIDARVKLTDQLMRRIEQMNRHMGSITLRLDKVEQSERECIERERLLRIEVDHGAQERQELAARLDQLEHRTNGH